MDAGQSYRKPFRVKRYSQRVLSQPSLSHGAYPCIRYYLQIFEVPQSKRVVFRRRCENAAIRGTRRQSTQLTLGMTQNKFVARVAFLLNLENVAISGPDQNHVSRSTHRFYDGLLGGVFYEEGFAAPHFRVPQFDG